MEEGKGKILRHREFVTYHFENVRYDLVGRDLAILLEEFASFERDSGYISCVPVLMLTIGLMNRATGHGKRPQQLDSGLRICERLFAVIIDRLRSSNCNSVTIGFAGANDV